jgi:hypothetical protein
LTPSDHEEHDGLRGRSQAAAPRERLRRRPRRRRLVAIIGKIAPQAECNKDQDATPVTTVRAKRVKITG